MPSPLLYEINTRCWLKRLAGQPGRPFGLADVPESEYARWQDLGFTHIWLMGVWTTGPRSRACALSQEMWPGYREALPDCQEADVAGSPYAVADYRVPEGLGGESGLRKFRQKLQERGMKLVLDFVPNHLGLDHRWVTERPDLFLRSASPAAGTFRQETRAGVRWLAHGRDPYFPPWTDTVQLDYRNQATRSAMSDLLLSIADRGDGVRCDMAMLILNEVFERTWAQFPAATPAPPPASPGAGENTGPAREFWKEAIAAVKRAHPDFVFLAEVYWGLEERLRAQGFDYTYDKELYDELVHRHPDRVRQHLLNAGVGSISAGAHFLENHDEPRVASLLSAAAQRAAALVILALPGMRFLHDGQLQGARRRLPVQLSRCCSEPVQRDLERTYEQLLAGLKQTAIGRGQSQLLIPQQAWAGNPTAGNFVVIQWQADPPDFDLAVVNLAPHQGQCYAPIGVEKLPEFNWLMQGLLEPEEYRRNGDDLHRQGVYLDLPAHGAQVFHFRPVA